jgi:hypothetical protein
MKKYLMLIFSIVILVSVSGCGLKTASYEGATEIKMADEDKEAFVSKVIKYDYTLYNHSADFMWTTDEAADVQKSLDKSLPKDKWRLATDWSSSDALVSEWKNGDISLVVYLVGNLDGTQISKYERRYGMNGIEPGATLILMYSFDKSKALPDKTGTAAAKDSKSVTPAKTSTPSAKKQPTPKK